MYRPNYQLECGEFEFQSAYASSGATLPPQAEPRSQALSSFADLENSLSELTPNKRAVIEALLTRWLSDTDASTFSDLGHLRHAS